MTKWTLGIIGGVVVILLLAGLGVIFGFGYVARANYLYRVFPSESMYPTLRSGDRVLFRKLDPEQALGRGEIVLHHSSQMFGNRVIEPKDYARRIVGLPGEKVIVRASGIVEVNDVPLERREVGTFTFQSRHRDIDMTLYLECVTEAVCYQVAQHDVRTPQAMQEAMMLGEDEYFLLGDNRDNSMDSRFAAVGPIPRIEILGKASEVVFGVRTKSVFKDISLPPQKVAADE